MSLFDLQDVCIAIGSIATLDLPMVVDLIGIYGLKGPYCTLTTTNWFLQALSVIPRGSWGDVARRSYHDPLVYREVPFSLRNRSEPGTSCQQDSDLERPMNVIVFVLYRIDRIPAPVLIFFRCLAGGRDPDPNSLYPVRLYSYRPEPLCYLLVLLVHSHTSSKPSASTQFINWLIEPVLRGYFKPYPRRTVRHSRCRYSDLQDVCMAIESLMTLDLPMVVDSIGIYELKGPYYTLTMTDWFLQVLSVIPRGSWGDVARRFTMAYPDGGYSKSGVR
ncbi:hypothetical protein F511_33063 [Dorcoceras hygrometricum]|uniref:Uncharacterized protein n=1 Tax=Dorcoceras hygrometricum TaxID=472368 RepID=A0A2Z7DCA8_9LAMI|nr:hypothetical protein F511_33063 [Dorcoceras hygrometricum]